MNEELLNARSTLQKLVISLIELQKTQDDRDVLTLAELSLRVKLLTEVSIAVGSYFSEILEAACNGEM